jgi:hypothetical protein
MPFKIHMTPNVIGEDASVHGQDIQYTQGNQSPPPAYGDRFSDLIVAVATQLDNCGHPMLADVDSARSSSEQSARIHATQPAPRYEEVA